MRTLPMALYPVASANDWADRVLAQYPADNAASVATGRKASKARKIGSGFSKSRI